MRQTSQMFAIKTFDRDEKIENGIKKKVYFYTIIFYYIIQHDYYIIILNIHGKGYTFLHMGLGMGMFPIVVGIVGKMGTKRFLYNCIHIIYNGNFNLYWV